MVLSALVLGAATYALTKSRSFQLAGVLVERAATDRKLVALTFDDGPEPGYTEEVLGVLRAHEASATFYLTGAASVANSTQLQAITAAGHELGNHTYSHQRLLFVPGTRIAEEIERTDMVFRSAGYDGPITFRPPGCKRLLSAPLFLARTGRTTVTWDLEPDSRPALADDPDAMTRHVLDNARPGSIVLMHVMYASRSASRQALPQILDGLAEKGYRFVTVSELLRARAGQ